MPIKSVKMKISKKTRFFLMCQGSLNQKNQVPRSKDVLCSPPTDRHTDRQTHTKVTTVGTLSGFQEFFLQPIIKDRPNPFQTLGGKIWPLVLNQPVTFVPRSVRCSSALCWFHFSLFFFGHHKIIKELQCLQRYRRHMM